MNTENQKYEGKFVFLEASDQKSRYYNGEYLCVRQTPATLYCVKPSIGYDGHEIKALSLIGADAYRVIEDWQDDAAAIKFGEQQKEWGEQIAKPDFKPAWIGSVYSKAQEVGRAVARCYEKKLVNVCVAPDLTTAEFTVPKGVTRVALKFEK